jgi:hypothetical protein
VGRVDFALHEIVVGFLLQGDELRVGQDRPGGGDVLFQGNQKLIEADQIVAQPDGAYARGRNKHALLA